VADDSGERIVSVKPDDRVVLHKCDGDTSGLRLAAVSKIVHLRHLHTSEAAGLGAASDVYTSSDADYPDGTVGVSGVGSNDLVRLPSGDVHIELSHSGVDVVEHQLSGRLAGDTEEQGGRFTQRSQGHGYQISSATGSVEVRVLIVWVADEISRRVEEVVLCDRPLLVLL